MKKFVSVILSFALVLCLVSCSGALKPKEKFKASFIDLFDTASTIIAYDNSQQEFDRKYQMLYEELKTYDQLYDIYNEYDGVTNLCTVNKTASKSPVKVDKKIIDMLKYGKQVYKITNGKTNICMGAVLKLWHNEREYAKDNPDDARLPDAELLKQMSKHTDIDSLVIDEENNTVFFTDELLQLDVGAVAKGYAVRCITQYAKDNLWSDAAISIGGNVSTYGYKNSDGKTKWAIGIENPDLTADDYLLMLDITDKSIVTSGDYQRYYYVGDKKYCHIINPDTLMPSEYVASVSVICDDSALGDAMSTALFNMPIDEGLALVNSMDSIEAVWVDREFNKTFSNGFEQYIETEK